MILQPLLQILKQILNHGVLRTERKLRYQTDEHIREALNRDLAGTTTIIISHRITTLMDCDNILVLEHGKVLQRGTPQELLRQPGLFRQIYDMQMSIGEEEPA